MNVLCAQSYPISEYVCFNRQYVLDHDTWIFNLTEANSAPVDQTPRWFKEYSFRDEYNVSSLSPAVLGDVAVKEWTEDVSIQRMVRFRRVGGQRDDNQLFDCGVCSFGRTQ